MSKPKKMLRNRAAPAPAPKKAAPKRAAPKKEAVPKPRRKAVKKKIADSE